MSEPCTKEQIIGGLLEFVENTKGMRTAIISIVVAIVIQVGTFLFLWGVITNTVDKNTEYLWGDVTRISRDNTRNIDRLVGTLENIKYIVVTGMPKTQGIPGNFYEKE